MADKFDVGDVIRMKKPHPCGRVGNPACRSRFPVKVCGMWSSDHGFKKTG